MTAAPTSDAESVDERDESPVVYTCDKRWEAERKIPANDRAALVGLPVRIEIPPICLATGAAGPQNGLISWKLTVRAAVTGLDFEANFPVVVMDPQEAADLADEELDEAEAR